MAYTTAQLLGALLTVDGRAVQGGAIELPPNARLLLDVLVEGTEDGALLDEIAAAVVEAKAARDEAVDISGISTPDGLVATLVALGGSDTRAALVALLTRRGVFMGDFPRQGAETTDDAAFDRALAYAEANDINLILFGAQDYTFTASHVLDREGMTLLGMGWKTRLVWAADVTVLDVTGGEFLMRDLQTYAASVGRTTWPIRTTGLRPVFDHVFLYGYSGAWRNGVWFAAGNDATVSRCLFNHAAIRATIYDLTVSNTWVQAISTEYGIRLDAGQGNLELTDVKIVPPLRSVADAVAGLYVQGPAFKIALNGVYIDGGSGGALETREGVILDSGVGQVTGSVNSNMMSSDVIVLNGVIGVDLEISAQGNNHRGNGSREVRITQTGAQPVRSVRIHGHVLRNSAVGGDGIEGPAVHVESPVDCSEVTIDVDVIQPAAGGGYSVPEILVHDPDSAIITGRGTLSRYKAHGSIPFAATDTGVLINLSDPYPMAYRPLASDINLVVEGQNVVLTRVQFTSDNQIYVPFAAAATGAGEVHWRVDFSR